MNVEFKAANQCSDFPNQLRKSVRRFANPDRRGLEFKAANQCSDFLNPFRKSPDVYGV